MQNNDDMIKQLLEIAKKASSMAYAPYSNFCVGAALFTEKGSIYSGCNVENASYSLSSCAEKNAIFSAVSAEGSQMKIKMIVIVTNKGLPAPPCGACRQVIAEFSNKTKTEIIFHTKEGIVRKKINELLPDVFELE